MERVGKEKIKRESGYFYYVNREGFACRAKSGTGKGKQFNTPEEKVSLEQIYRIPGHLYFIDKEGYICRRKSVGRPKSIK